MCNESKYMTPEELATMFNVHRNMVNYWVTANLIPHVRVGNCVRFERDKMPSWIESISQPISI